MGFTIQPLSLSDWEQADAKSRTEATPLIFLARLFELYNDAPEKKSLPLTLGNGVCDSAP